MITFEQFRQMIPTNREPRVWYDIAVDMFKKYDITSTNRIAGFMAQCAHESRDFTALEENLNYSADALNRVFPRYFGSKKRNAFEYARNPQKLANYVYMDEFRTKAGALGNTQPGDGWRFRGGGIKQLTGRNNFAAFGSTVGMTAEEAADYVRTKKGAFESACWFWKKNNLNRFADKDDIVGMSRKVNGGTIGMEDRVARYERAKRILSNAPAVVASRPAAAPRPVSRVLKRGMTGDDVRRMQRVLGVAADGIFGFNTTTALRKWQRSNGIPVTGIADQDTLKKMFSDK
jgi:putative chitinase